MQTSEQELNQMKNKVTRDLATVERNTDDKIKQIRKNAEENAEAFETKIDAQIEMFKDKIKAVEEKLAKVEETSVVMEFINQLVASTKKELEEKTTEQGAELKTRIDQIHDVHLEHEGLFGPEHETHKTFKDYIFQELESVIEQFKKKEATDKKIAVNTTNKFGDINKRLDADISNKLQELGHARDGILEKIEEMSTFTLIPLQNGANTMG